MDLLYRIYELNSSQYEQYRLIVIVVEPVESVDKMSVVLHMEIAPGSHPDLVLLTVKRNCLSCGEIRDNLSTGFSTKNEVWGSFHILEDL